MVILFPTGNLKGGEMMKRKPYLKLKAYFVERGITQTEVAKFLGIPKSNLSTRINGSGADFRLDEVRKICKHYCIDANEYFFY